MPLTEVGAVRATQLIEQGITCCKLDPFPIRVLWPGDFPLTEINRTAQVFRIIRDAIGDKREVGICTHGQINTGSAIRVAIAPLFLEEPVENFDEMAQVVAHTSILIPTRERLVTEYEFAELLDRHAAYIIQLDVGQCGGILDSKKILAPAEVSYPSFAPQMFCRPIATAAAVQLELCCPSFLIQEYKSTGLHSDIFLEPLRLENGHIIPPGAGRYPN